MKKIYIVILFLFISKLAFSQSFTGAGSGTFSVSSLLYVSLTAGSSISSTMSGVSTLASGTTITNAATIAIKSNELWLVTMKANAANFTPGGTGSTNMPCSIVGIRVNGGGTFTYLTTADQTLKTGNRGSTAVSGNTFSTDMNFNPGFGYKGDTYTLSVIYTISIQ